MKRFVIVVAIFAMLFAVQGQNNKTTTANKKSTSTSSYTGNGAEIKFDKLTVDFGNLKVGDTKVVTITYTNIGKKPLILDDVISSCDCTTVTWDKQPVMPGKQGTIKATYKAKNVGLISKRLTVLSNANTDRVILQLKGEVK